MPSSLWPFQSPADHEGISAIIRDRSTNQADVRQAALADLDLSGCRKILDLGCGFGFMADVLARRAAPDARVVGVDMWANNEGPFLERVAATGRRGAFICDQVGTKFPCRDGEYDLVICSYSLYFFPDALPEVARVLAPDGLFVTITHSAESFVGLLDAAGPEQNGTELLALARNFSAENGEQILRQQFKQVTRIDYPNALRFDSEHLDELLAYLRFKLPFFVDGAQPGDELPEDLVSRTCETMSRSGQVIVEKSDAVFHCRSPKCP
jgi:SAM-dependent methyltransferase